MVSGMSPSVDLSARFGQVVKARRQALGLSQEQLAADAGLGRTFVSLIERGLRRATLETVASIASVLGATVAELLAEAEGKAHGTSRRGPGGARP
jgi:transcriptional regulator with XRE-family HTH domain